MNVLAFPAPVQSEIITFEIEGDPVAFARARSNGRQRFTPPKQRHFMQIVRDAAIRAKGKNSIWIDRPVAMELTAVFAYPESWPMKRKHPHYKISKPDVDNCGKIVADACNGILFKDDAQIAVMSCSKVYGPTGKLVVSFHPIMGQLP